MLKTRLIPVLLLKNGILVRSRNFTFHQMMGNHIEQVKRFSEWKADEIVYLDISRDDSYGLDGNKNIIGSSSSNSEVVQNSKKNIIDIISDLSRICRVPLSVGGKIRTLEDIKKRLKAGADKVVINSVAIDNPEFIKKAAEEFGSQCIVVSIDVKKTSMDKWNIFKYFGKNITDLNLTKWIEIIQELGAGEILIQSIDRDGTSQGYDLDLLKSISKKITVPCIILGGAGNFDDFVKAHAINNEVSLAAANVFHFTEQSVLNAKKYMFKNKINVRV
jgi:cyclase